MQDYGRREEVKQGYGPGGRASGPAGSQLMGFSVEDGQGMGGVAVMLRSDPQLRMGVETEESGGEAAPQKLQDGEFQGKRGCGRAAG